MTTFEQEQKQLLEDYFSERAQAQPAQRPSSSRLITNETVARLNAGFDYRGTAAEPDEMDYMADAAHARGVAFDRPAALQELAVARYKEGIRARQAEEQQARAQENRVKMLASLGDTAAKTGMDVRHLAGMVGVNLGQAPGQTDDRGALGAQAGLPPPPPAQQANAGLSRALREKLQLAAAKSQDKRIAGLEESQGALDATEQQVNRFLERNAATPTGGAYSIPGVKQGLTMFSPARQEMDAITAQMVPVVGRQGLPGSASNLDVQMFKQAVPGQDKSLEANMAIGNALIQQAQRGREHTEYLRTYADAYGSLTGADAAWQKYANANPIFDPQAAAAGKTKLNAGRKSWAEYFAGQRGTTPAASAPAAGRPPLSSFAR